MSRRSYETRIWSDQFLRHYRSVAKSKLIVQIVQETNVYKLELAKFMHKLFNNQYPFLLTGEYPFI